MVAIPQTDGLPHSVGQSAAGRQTPSTPWKEGDVGRFLQRLNLEHDLNLPWNERESPSKRRKSPGHGVASAISFLCFQDPLALNGAIEELRSWGDSLASKEKKIDFLLERLSIAKTESIKAKRTTGSRRSPEKLSPTKRPPRNQSSAARSEPPASRKSEQLPDPASPTLSIKHAPYSSFEMPADDLAFPAAGISMPSFKRPRSPKSPAEGMAFSRSARRVSMPRPSGKEDNPTYPNLPPPTSDLTSYKSAGYNSVNTSFTSNGLETSFWSNAQQETQDPASPATTVDDSFHTTEEERELGLHGANDCNDIRSSQSENYGEFPSQLDGLLDIVRQPGPGVAAHALAAKTPPSSFHASGLDDLATQQRQLPSSAASVPRLHQLSGKARVESIPDDGLSSTHLPACFASLPMELRWDIMRVLQTKKMTAQELSHAWKTSRDTGGLCDVARSHGIDFKASDIARLDDLTFTANFRWVRSSRGPVFDLQLLPAREVTSNSFLRKFGGHRFLTLNLPSPACPFVETDLQGLRDAIAEQIGQMLTRAHTFLGRHWRRILVQNKDTKPNDPDFSRAGCTQVLFFAEYSDIFEDDLQIIEHEDVVDWWLQFAANQHTLACKLGARLELAVSRTTPCKRLRKEDIECGVPDIMPTDDPDSTEFDDERLPNPMLKSTEPMNDGCNRIASSLVRSAQERFELSYLPSVVQARVFGAKGLWVRDDDVDQHYGFSEPAVSRPAISLGNSQIKVCQSADSLFDPEKLNLNVNNFDRAPEPAMMYMSFLPILVDRHVPKENIVDVAQESVQQVTQAFEEALYDRAKMLHWTYANCPAPRTEQGDNVLSAFPSTKEERVRRMTLSGFEPSECQHLAKKVSQTGALHFKDVRERMRIPIRKSTTLFGICDPTGTVEPGTIHVSFRDSFNDGEQALPSLRGTHALVGRLPALGPSDMQKVRCVFRAELAHLPNVAVFSARGPCSLASKLQGGDYDGDKFVIIWDPRLVKKFRNAPVHEEPDKPETFGIKCDKTLVKNAVPTDEKGKYKDEDVRRFLDGLTRRRLGLDWVGTVTNTYDELVYHEGNMHSHAATALRHLHDYLLDAPKRGYSFDHVAWARFRSKYKLRKMETPAHKKYSTGGDVTKMKPKDDNIVDYILFHVVEPELQAALKKAHVLAERPPQRDDQLNSVFSDRRRSCTRGTAGRNELESLLVKVEGLREDWQRWMEDYRNATDKTRSWTAIIKKARQAFEAIVPDDLSCETKCWLEKTGSAPSQWDLLKASALGVAQCSQSLMFEAAGLELCEIKARAAPSLAMRMDSFLLLKQRPLGRKAGEVDADGEIRGDRGMEIAEME